MLISNPDRAVDVPFPELASEAFGLSVGGVAFDDLAFCILGKAGKERPAGV
jgi:hypothetical protein